MSEHAQNELILRGGSTAYSNAVRSLHASVDAVFVWLLPAQWIALCALAFFYTPTTWIGSQPAVHTHVWAAVLLGAFLTIPATALARFRPGEGATRAMIAAAQMLLGSLFIHSGGGRLEMHFHVFVSLALLAAYRDWRILVLGAAVAAVDHVIRGIFFRLSIYGVQDASQLRWIEHAVWVVLEVAFLIWTSERALAEMRKSAEAAAAVEQGARKQREAVAAIAADLKSIESTGDLTRKVRQAPGELGEISGSVNGFIVSLRGVLS
jgi:hypothetical protein